MGKSLEPSVENQSQEAVAPRVSHLKKLTRRAFLSSLGALFTTAALTPEQLFAQGINTRPGPSSQDTPRVESSDANSEETEVNMGLIKIYLDSNDNPQHYSLNYGEKVPFSEDEKLYLLEAKQNAVSSGEVQPALQFREFGIIPEYNGTKERPLITDAPEDILSPEQLKERRVTVINPASPDSSHLYLRDDIFKKQGMLEAHVVLNEHLPEESKRDLVIVVFDGEFVTPEYMTGAEYQDVYPLLDTMLESVETYRRNRIVLLEQDIKSAKRSLETMDESAEEYFQIKDKIMEYKADILLYSRTLSTSELVGEAFAHHQKVREDTTAIGKIHYSNEDHPNTSYIFLAAPSARDTVGQRINTVTYSPDGSLGFFTYDRDPDNGAATPRVDQGFTTPDDLTEYADEELKDTEYLIKNKTSGFVAAHEIAHYDLAEVLPTLSQLGLMTESKLALFIRNIPEIDEYIDRYKEGVIDSTFPKIRNERLTDIVARECLLNDYRKWKESGYTDYSKIFPVVYKVPSTPNQPQGGYQLTDFSGNKLLNRTEVL